MNAFSQSSSVIPFLPIEIIVEIVLDTHKSIILLSPPCIFRVPHARETQAIS